MTVSYLVPSANATATTTQILATNNYTLINEGLTTPNGSVNNTNIDDTSAAGTNAIWALTDVPGTIGTLNSATFRVRARFVNPGAGDTATYQFQLSIGGDVFNLTYSTAVDENNGFTNYSTSLSGGASYPYTTAQFNAATVTLSQTAYTKDMGPDGLYLDVDALEVEVDWSPAATPITVYPSGVAGTGSVGSPTTHGKANTTTTGVGATGSVASVTTGISKTVPVTGLSATAAVNSVTVQAVQAPTVTVNGLAATGAVGSVTLALECTVAVSGLSASGQVGTAATTAESLIAVSGLAATSAMGTVTVDTGAVTWEQEGFRFRNDDGTETTATWVASQDSNVSLPAEINYRLRILSLATNNPPGTTATLQYRKVGDSEWQTIL